MIQRLHQFCVPPWLDIWLDLSFIKTSLGCQYSGCRGHATVDGKSNNSGKFQRDWTLVMTQFPGSNKKIESTTSASNMPIVPSLSSSYSPSWCPRRQHHPQRCSLPFLLTTGNFFPFFTTIFPSIATHVDDTENFDNIVSPLVLFIWGDHLSKHCPFPPLGDRTCGLWFTTSNWQSGGGCFDQVGWRVILRRCWVTKPLLFEDWPWCMLSAWILPVSVRWYMTGDSGPAASSTLTWPFH
jgi:hypothetical protein